MLKSIPIVAILLVKLLLPHSLFANQVNIENYSIDGKKLINVGVNHEIFPITNDSIIITDIHKKYGTIYYSTKEHGVIKHIGNVTEKSNNGLPTKIVNEKKVYRVITHIGGNDSTIYATTKHNLFTKRINDTSWVKMKEKWADLTSADMDNNGNIVVGTALRGSFFSKDSGKTFFRLPYPKSSHESLGNFESVSFIKIFKNTIYKAYQFNGIVYSINIDSLNTNKTVVYKKRRKKKTNIVADVTFNEYIISKDSPIYFPLSSMHDAEIIADTTHDSTRTIKMVIYTPKQTSVVTITNHDTLVVDQAITMDKISLLTGAIDGKQFILNNYYNCAPLRNDTKDLQGSDTLITHYIPTYKLKTKKQIQQKINRYKDTKINAFVIDLKDDHGNIRYNSKLEMVKKARTLRPFIKDMDMLVTMLHEADIKLIARIVVFKDEKMSKYKKDKFAIWDSKTNKAMRNDKEAWCDPFNTEYGDYVISIVEELEQMGVDEIQFDYIRFPTDYLPKTIKFRYQKNGANKRDAIETFLSRAQARLTIPISADIYGGSGWYNKSTGVGQEMDMLKNYVDIICPMSYPSHYMDSFFRDAPEIDRPFRIYAHGTMRARELSGGYLKVRQYIQAFTLGGISKYDRKYCKVGAPYFKQQIDACDSTGGDGYGYWNAAGSDKYIKKLIKK